MQVFRSDDPNQAAVVANNSAKGPAIWAEATDSRAVVGVGYGDSAGVWGEVDTGRAVVGVVRAGGGAGVWGETTNGTGLVGKDNGGGDGVVGEGRRGVVGKSQDYQGVYGWSRDNSGVVGESERMHAIFGVSHAPGFAAVFGTAADPAALAGSFDGNVEIGKKGRLTLRGGDVILANADCAEDFDIVGDCDPGTVMVFTDNGALRASGTEYDRRVAGVVSGAGGYRPAIIMDRPEPVPGRFPIALVGKVFCKVEASTHPVRFGDLLTTSAVPGHAMTAVDPARAFGSVIGKSLGVLASGAGLLPILVALQ